MTSRWFAASTIPKQEIIALKNLANQEFEAFLPTVDRKVTRRKKPVVIREALYRSYVFIRFDPDQDAWWSVNGTRGIRRLICYASERPRPLEEGVIEQLIRQSHAGGFEEVAGFTRKIFKPGSTLEITEGPLEGHNVTCLQEADEIVRVFLDCFGRETVVNVALAHLRAA